MTEHSFQGKYKYGLVHGWMKQPKKSCAAELSIKPDEEAFQQVLATMNCTGLDAVFGRRPNQCCRHDGLDCPYNQLDCPYNQELLLDPLKESF